MTTYHGSCHCKAVRFEADFELADGTVRCNCSICSKSRWWGAMIPPTQFRLLAGEEALTQYTFGAHLQRHQFCRHCGVRMFEFGTSPLRGDFVALNVMTLDGVPDEVLTAVPIRYIDGRDERWMDAPAVTAHL
jgi:hypothetical protein